MVSTSNAKSMGTLVNWEQVVPIISKSARLYCRLADHQKKSLVVKRIPVMMKYAVVRTVLGTDAKM